MKRLNTEDHVENENDLKSIVVSSILVLSKLFFFSFTRHGQHDVPLLLCQLVMS